MARVDDESYVDLVNTIVHELGMVHLLRRLFPCPADNLGLEAGIFVRGCQELNLVVVVFRAHLSLSRYESPLQLRSEFEVTRQEFVRLSADDLVSLIGVRCFMALDELETQANGGAAKDSTADFPEPKDISLGI